MEDPMMYFDKVQDAAGGYRFRFKNEKGVVLFRSIAFESESDRDDGIRTFFSITSYRGNFQNAKAKNGKYFFRLYDPSTNLDLGISETFEKSEIRELTIKFILSIALKRNLKVLRDLAPKGIPSLFSSSDPNVSRNLDISILPGSAPPEEIANLLAKISLLYRKFGGSGLTYSLEGIEESTQIELA